MLFITKQVYLSAVSRALSSLVLKKCDLTAMLKSGYFWTRYNILIFRLARVAFLWLSHKVMRCGALGVASTAGKTFQEFQKQAVTVLRHL